MSDWIKVACLHCFGEFQKRKSDIRRSPNNFCSKQCSSSHRARRNVERFYDRCQKTKDCWKWTGSLNSSGYGFLKIMGRVRLAHRASYEISVGAIPLGMCVMHSCDNPACINPDHLSLGSHLENMRDMRTKGRGASKLDLESASRIRESSSSNKDLAAKFGVSQRTIRNIKAGHSWQLPAPPTE